MIAEHFEPCGSIEDEILVHTLEDRTPEPGFAQTP